MVVSCQTENKILFSKQRQEDDIVTPEENNEDDNVNYEKKQEDDISLNSTENELIEVTTATAPFFINIQTILISY